MEEKELRKKKFRFVWVHKTFLVLYPFGAIRFSLFPNLQWRHKFNIAIWGILGFLKNIHKLRYNREKNRLLVFHIWGLGYYHFITEVLIKLVLHREQIKNNTILLPHPSPAFVYEALEMLNIRAVEELKTPTIYRSIELIENPGKTFYQPIHFQKLREQFLRDITPTDTNKKIYISRKNARARKVHNEEEIEQVLLQQGFIICHPEALSFRGQVILFSSADTLVSIHGAGLTNMVFMQSSSRIVELMPEYSSHDHYPLNFCYQALAAHNHFQYQTIFCKRVRDSDQFDICNIIVDRSHLLEAFQNFIH